MAVQPAAPGDFVYAPEPDFTGEDTFAIEVMDSSGFTATAWITVTVQPVNDAPEITLTSVITLAVGEEVNLPVPVRDADSDDVTLSVSVCRPAWSRSMALSSGVVADEAAGAPYFSIFSAEDAERAITAVPGDRTAWPVQEAPVEQTPIIEEVPIIEETPVAEPTAEETPIGQAQPPSPLLPVTRLRPLRPCRRRGHRPGGLCLQQLDAGQRPL